MKKILTGIMAVAVLLFSAGCEKIIEFKGDVTEPRLTLSSYAEVGEPLTVYVASSIFFLSDQKYGRAFTEGLDTTRGSVRCFVNGSNTPRELQLVPGADVSSFCYRDPSYAPAPGDHIRLEAEFPGFDPVWAETDVPLMPTFEVVSAQWRLTDMSDWVDIDDDWVLYDLDLTLAVTDDGKYDKYYYLQPITIYQSEWAEENYTVFYSFSSNDIIFKEMSGGNALSLLNRYGGYFSDELIKGQRHTFTITISEISDREDILYFGLIASTVNEHLYWYDVSYQQTLSAMGGLFGEGATLYSNVHGGYGFFAASAPVLLDVEW